MKLLTHCLCCGEAVPPPFLSLGKQPLANSYHDGTTELPCYPLEVTQCLRCTHRQLTVAVDPEILFGTYLYVSGTSATSRHYFADFAERVVNQVGSTVKVLDIASNDGSLLEAFAPKVNIVHGVDPAGNLCEIAQSKGLKVTNAFWSHALAQEWNERYEVIVAMNVLGHVADPLDFLCGCKQVLAPGGRLYIQTSQCDWLETGEFDCVYHEHLSYFTEASLRALSQRAQLHVGQVEKVPMHGRSWLFTLTDPLSQFAAEVQRIGDWTRGQIMQARAEGDTIVGYGAAAKANTFLNYAGISLDYILDDNSLKWGLLTPGRNIPIHSPEYLTREERPVLLVLLAWNFEEEIVQKVSALREGKRTRFLRYFPTQKLF